MEIYSPSGHLRDTIYLNGILGSGANDVVESGMTAKWWHINGKFEQGDAIALIYIDLPLEFYR